MPGKEGRVKERRKEERRQEGREMKERKERKERGGNGILAFPVSARRGGPYRTSNPRHPGGRGSLGSRRPPRILRFQLGEAGKLGKNCGLRLSACVPLGPHSGGPVSFLRGCDERPTPTPSRRAAAFPPQARAARAALGGWQLAARGRRGRARAHALGRALEHRFGAHPFVVLLLLWFLTPGRAGGAAVTGQPGSQTEYVCRRDSGPRSSPRARSRTVRPRA